jgi:hypothetical protein
MRKLGLLFCLIMVGPIIMAQSIDRSQYDETTLFDVKLWEREGTTMATKKYKATVIFVMQGSSATCILLILMVNLKLLSVSKDVGPR